MSSNLALLIPIAAITIGPASWAFTTWVRAKHGYPLSDRKGQMLVTRNGDLSIDRQTELLKSENDRLTGQVSRLEERIAVLERIATDPAERTSREIEALRTRD
ncbi:hypothetical protein QH494_08425 [Sphingomonas sp. AR_OL41]|uniref:hypothetical protein n=1 Tax=Sphingomonas sp. AR_OL41 TaxID=3042729 RepID=UPI0024800301|nr:hypothetical protein [Sphingomonas sp. AR_OL41]MDH7972208.1 hypothetical protein [Sphingomonas sp. AR_OL41]